MDNILGGAETILCQRHQGLAPQPPPRQPDKGHCCPASGRAGGSPARAGWGRPGSVPPSRSAPKGAVSQQPSPPAGLVAEREGACGVTANLRALQGTADLSPDARGDGAQGPG